MSEYDGELPRLVEQVNRSAKESKADDVKLLDRFLTVATERRASDLLLVGNSPAVLRVNGSLTRGIGPSLSPAEYAAFCCPF
jgi:Tfp pilus assembly ATPase PilU